jgi:tetratricopeptide (TPR) repeat protein
MPSLKPPKSSKPSRQAGVDTEPNVAQALRQARQLLLSGGRDAAQQIYESILRESPKSAEALHLLGVIKLQTGAFQDAVALIRNSIKINPIQSEAHSNLAHCYNATGRAKDAKTHAEYSIRLDPLNPNPYINKGLAHLALREFSDAEKCFFQALDLDSQSAEATYNLGLLYFEMQDFPAAKTQFEKAAELAPHSADIQHNLALTHQKLSEPLAAELCIKKAISLNPDNTQFQISYAALLIKASKNEAAIIALQGALSKQPENSKAFYNLARAYRNLGRLSEAAECCEKAFRLDSSNHKALFNESIFRLTLGDFVRGWDAYKARWKIDLYGKPPRLKQPYWNGELLSSTLMVWGEQGVGDEILHFSLLKEVQERVKRVVVYTDKRLIPLLMRSFPGIEFRERAVSISETDFEKWICSGDLGGIFRGSWESFKHQPTPYLAADPASTRKIRDRLRSDKRLICGLSWTSKSKEHEFRKSLRISDLIPILKTPGFDFVDISYVDSENDREAALLSSGTCLNRIKDVDHFNDIDQWSSVIDACDVVITVSNTTAHIAGGLGKKTVVLLPFSEGSLWYWHQGQKRSVWYPGTTLLRQQIAGDWAFSVNESIKILNNLLNAQT